jgi:hypothetical protein
MSTPTYLSITEGAGKKVAAASYTEAGQTVLDQKILVGEQYLSTYTVNALGILTTTTGAHLLQVMAGTGLNIRLRHIAVWQSVLATASAFADLSIVRLTSAGSGGTVITPAPHDPADTATATAMSLPSSKGSLGVVILQPTVCFSQTVPLSGPNTLPLLFEHDWDGLRSKPPIISAGTSSGIAIQIVTGVATATVNIALTFTELSF